MTFVELQNQVMARMNLTTTEARTRIKSFLNIRMRSLQTSIGLGQVRFASGTFPTVAGTFTYSPTNLIKPLALSIPALNRVLDERTKDQILIMDPGLQQTGAPIFYAITNYGATSCTLYLWPKPDAIYTIGYDGIIKGTDMVADGDIPVVPEDFHDILIFGATSDELLHKEKIPLSREMGQQVVTRTGELRYFIGKSAYLGLMQGDSAWWGWGPWYNSYAGYY